MAVTLDATVGGASANSYITRADANAYFEMSLFADPWSLANDERKEKALISATRILDQECDWIGTKASTTQALRWPRLDVITQDGEEVEENVIPLAVQRATCELALSLLSANRLAEPDSKGIKKMKVDVLEFEFDKTDRADVLPLSVMSVLSFYIVNRGSSSSVVTLARA